MKLKPNEQAAAEVLDSLLKLDLTKATISLSLGSVIGDDRLPEMQNVQITDDLADEFREVSQERLNLIRKENLQGDLRLRAYSTGSKPDANEIEFLNISDFPHIKEQLTPLASLADLKTFEMANDFVAGLRFYVITIGTSSGKPLYCFRSYGQKKELARSPQFAALLTKGHFDRVREPMFLFDHHLDALAYDDSIFVLNQDKFQKIFRFFELVATTAEHTLRTIKKVIPILNFPEFEKACMGHLQKLTKLRNISQKPYLTKITIGDLKKVIKRYDLEIQTRKVDGLEMLVFDPSDRWAILKLLDDDYLESVMTEERYEVSGKRPHGPN